MEINVRMLRVKDIIALHKLFDLQSEELKKFFNPYWLGFSNVWKKTWLLRQISIMLSIIKSLRSFLKKIYPKGVLSISVAVNESKEIIGLVFLIFDNFYSASLGIFVSEEYQGKGVASKLMSFILAKSKEEGLREINLCFNRSNERARHLYEKYDFERVGYDAQAEAVYMKRKL